MTPGQTSCSSDKWSSLTASMWSWDVYRVKFTSLLLSVDEVCLQLEVHARAFPPVCHINGSGTCYLRKCQFSELKVRLASGCEDLADSCEQVSDRADHVMMLVTWKLWSAVMLLWKQVILWRTLMKREWQTGSCQKVVRFCFLAFVTIRFSPQTQSADSDKHFITKIE